MSRLNLPQLETVRDNNVKARDMCVSDPRERSSGDGSSDLENVPKFSWPRRVFDLRLGDIGALLLTAEVTDRAPATSKLR